MKPNLANWHKKHGTFMYPGSTGFKFNFSPSSFKLPRVSTALLLSVCVFVASLASGSLVIASVMGLLTLGFQLLFSTNMRILGTTPPTPEEVSARLKTECTAIIDEKLKGIKGITPEQEKDLTDLKTNIEKLSKVDADVVTKLRTDLDAAMLEVKGLKAAPNVTIDKASLPATLKSWIETNKDSLAKIRAGEKGSSLTPLVVKLNSPMTPSNTYNGSAFLPQPEFAPGATEIVRVQPTFWDYIKKGRTGAAAYVWVNKKNPEGAAAFIGPGVVKPGISFEIATETSNAKKIAVSEKCATELLEDIDGMQSWIEQELSYQLKAKMNTTLMTGVASSTVPAGIQTISVPYSLAGISTTNANRWDALRAAVAQLRSGNLQGTVTAFVNPVDYANMVLTKAQSQGQLFMPAETGATIVEDNNVPIGFVQVALLDYYKILIYKDLTITFGLDGEDFSHNLITGIAEMRIHQFFSENHTGAFIYDEFQDIIDAINTVGP